jgi:hypothetical protein
MGSGELGKWALYDCSGFLGINLGTGRRSGFDIPQAKVLENLFDHLLILYDADDFHLSGTFRQLWVKLSGLLFVDGQGLTPILLKPKAGMGQKFRKDGPFKIGKFSSGLFS